MSLLAAPVNRDSILQGFDRRPRSYRPRNVVEPWVFSRCILNNVCDRTICVEVFEDAAMHQWLMNADASMRDAMCVLTRNSEHAYVNVYNAEQKVFRINQVNTPRSVKDQIPCVGDDVDVTVTIKGAWENAQMRKKSMCLHLISIKKSEPLE